MSNLSIFELEFQKNYCHIWNQHSRNCRVTKFCAKRKIFKFGSIIWVYLGYYFKKQLSYFQSAHSNYFNCNIFQKNKTKMPKLGTKNALFLYSWAGIWKIYFHIWNYHLWICLDTKFGAKAKPLNLGPKMPDLSICWRLEIILSY